MRMLYIFEINWIKTNKTSIFICFRNPVYKNYLWIILSTLANESFRYYKQGSFAVQGCKVWNIRWLIIAMLFVQVVQPKALLSKHPHLPSSFQRAIPTPIFHLSSLTAPTSMHSRPEFASNFLSLSVKNKIAYTTDFSSPRNLNFF